MPIWIFCIFLGSTLIIFITFNKLNKNDLTVEERKLASSLVSQVFERELQHIWLIVTAVVFIYGFLFTLGRVFQVEGVTGFMFPFILFSVIYGFFRNRAIYRKANLPAKFISRDFALGMFISLALTAGFVFNLLD